MNLKKIITMLCVLLAGVLIGWIGQTRFGVLSSADSADSGHEGHGHGEGSAQVTVWNGRFEIFLEHPPIVVNEPTEFVTHVSDLVTLEPRRKGPVTFILQYGDETPIKHIEPKPARDGIYIPELTFPKPGQWRISLAIPYLGKDHVIDLPPFEAYASEAQAHNAPPAQQIEGISFLKERQWEISMKTELVESRSLLNRNGLVVPESAVIGEGSKSVAFVQLAGETFEERKVELGSRADGLVQVLSGLFSGERVVTKGADAVEEAAHANEGEQVVHLSEEDIARFAIEIGTAGPGEIRVSVRLPGQIKINTDRMAHIIPIAMGVVRQVTKSVGDTVAEGEVLAWLESTELGKAKVQYLSKLAEVGCCSIDLTRAEQVNENITRLLETLKTSPSLETLREKNGGAMDKNHSALVSAYAEFNFAKAVYLREKSLFEQKITSEQDYLTAESSFKKADALYAATRDSTSFEVQRSLLEAQRAQQIRKIELKGAERSLYVLGLTADDIKQITLAGQSQLSETEEELPCAAPCNDPNCESCAKAGADLKITDATEYDEHSEEEGPCNDPNCEECAKNKAEKKVAGPVDFTRSDDKLSWYPLRAPFAATVIEKHITLGEKLSGETSAFTVADLRTVWVDLNVHQKDLPLLKKGQLAVVSAGPGVPKVQGRISYVDPIVGESTRTALVRIVLDNTSGLLRPGTFVTAEVLVEQVAAKVAVERDVLQSVDNETTVFVRTGHGFEPRVVTLGRWDDTLVEITSGLNPGDQIATKNSFRLKAELKKDSGGHAGHGHAH